MASRPSIRQRPDRPSERFLTIFMKSSRKPIAPQASVVKSTSIASVLRLDRITNGSVVATRIRRPPMVGVPCFSAWPSGISPGGRTNWPTSLARSQAMNFGPRNISSVAAEMAAIRTRGNRPLSLGRDHRADALEPHRARALQQHDVAVRAAAPGTRSTASSTRRDVHRRQAVRARPRRRPRARPPPSAGRCPRPPPPRPPRGGSAPRRGPAPSCRRARPPGARRRPARSASAARIAIGLAL